MMGYLDDSVQEPPAVLIMEKEVSEKKEATESPNPAHAIWVTQDQQVLTFLISSLSREVLLQVSSFTTSAGIWKALLQSFASQSRARVIQLRSAIEHTRKEDLTAAAYYTKMVSIADELAAAGKPLDEDDVVSHILQGLLHEPDYNGFVSAISTRTATDQPIGLGELFSLLLAAESRIAAQHASFPSNHSANHASRGGGRGNSSRPGGNNGGGGPRGYNNNYIGGRYHDNSANNAGPGGAPRQGGGGRGDRVQEKCQTCKEMGHGAWRCKQRFDRSFNNNVRNPAGSGGGGNRSANAVHTYGLDTN